MSQPARYCALACLAGMSILTSVSGKGEAIRIATTVFEDLGQTDLVVLGKVVQREKAGGLNYVEMEIVEPIYGSTGSATISVVARGIAANTDAPTLSAPTITLEEAIGEHVLVFLKKASPEDFPMARMKGDLQFVAIRKIDLRGEQDRQAHIEGVKKLAEAVNVRDPRQREAIFLNLLSGHDHLITESAVKELGKLRSRKAIAALSRLAHAENQRVRFQVIDAMREIGGQEAMSIIVSALNDESPRVRARAASILGWMKARQETERLLRIVVAKDEDESVRISAVLALATMGSKEAIPLLQKTFNDETASLTLRETVKRALQQLE